MTRTHSESLPDVAIMVEGQDGLNWERLKRLAQVVDGLGFDGLFRSDHFTNPEGPVKDALDLWPSVTWLADNTDNIEFGPLVTPMSFRHPVHTARMAKDVDDLSDGRFVLGVGAGWQEREHDTFGFDLLSVPDRLDRFEEGVEVISALLRRDEPVSFEGDYYELDDAQLLPRPDRDGGPTLLVGGNGRNRTIPLAARYADEWNGVFLTVADYRERVEHLDDELAAVGRDPDDVRRSLMTRVVFGRDETEIDDVLGDEDRDALAAEGVIIGTETEVAEHLERIGEAGADRVMLQWLELDDVERLDALADSVL